MITGSPSSTQQQGQVITNQLAIPVGTNTVIPYNKFLWDKRDLNCGLCKNGLKSQLSRRINEKTYLVPVVCVCVPYLQSEDSDGVQTVVFKGRRERWIKGKRPEIYLSDEKVRASANKAAVTTKESFEGANVINGKKFQFVRPQNNAPQVPFLSKSVPGMSITKPGDVPTEFTTQSSLPENPHYGDVTEKNLQKAIPGAQKHMQTLPNGNRVFVNDATFAKLSGQPISVTTSSSSPAVVTTVTGDVTGNVSGKKRGRPRLL
jgi:hypothetical protein